MLNNLFVKTIGFSDTPLFDRSGVRQSNFTLTNEQFGLNPCTYIFNCSFQWIQNEISKSRLSDFLASTNWFSHELALSGATNIDRMFEHRYVSGVLARRILLVLTACYSTGHK